MPAPQLLTAQSVQACSAGAYGTKRRWAALPLSILETSPYSLQPTTYTLALFSYLFLLTLRRLVVKSALRNTVFVRGRVLAENGEHALLPLLIIRHGSPCCRRQCHASKFTKTNALTRNRMSPGEARFFWPNLEVGCGCYSQSSFEPWPSLPIGSLCCGSVWPSNSSILERKCISAFIPIQMAATPHPTSQ